jgi:cell division protein FtsQ
VSTHAPSPDAAVAAPAEEGWSDPADGPAGDPSPTRPVVDGRRRPRVRRRWLAVGAVGLAGIGWLGWGSPVTLVEHVVVAAPRGLSEEAIRLASGISASDHVPAVDEERVRAAIMAALPAVAHVEVRRELPDTIRLVVTARTPLAAVQSGKGYLVIDGAGVVYDRVGSARKLPVIRARTEAGRETARAVLLSLPDELRGEVRRVTATTRDDVTLALRGGATVRWGSPEQADLKARVLAGLVAVRAEVYDVRSPLQPTTTGGAATDEAPTP